MSQPDPQPEQTGEQARRPRRGLLDPVEVYHRRTAKIREEIARNRRGEYRVPTWVLALALVGVIGLWVLVLFVL